MDYNNKGFWSMLDDLVSGSEIVIDRPKGSRHPKYTDMLYEVDYGYLKNTASMDGGGIDIWRGTDEKHEIDGIICIVDLLKKDSEIKILSGCTNSEKETIYKFHNKSEFMKGIFISREGS
ncbi:inorganic pyrophosphatase [Clostridium estertheticum]|uniref:Inorganic pyrophosphatase n=1 Tax=Clostridium estertheticum TaxID=238834 RepID=A0A5N7J3I8_9CLOT|nr:inorganic pyrophosphatase [Clostridium estertheticum]MPQ32651.1 inorganic pyrophosphatase [Clostridium estertheticum]MPQ63310.1 inorganic pyrophosphatase [Clostridium estertheticum]